MRHQTILLFCCAFLFGIVGCSPENEALNAPDAISVLETKAAEAVRVQNVELTQIAISRTYEALTPIPYVSSTPTLTNTPRPTPTPSHTPSSTPTPSPIPTNPPDLICPNIGCFAPDFTLPDIEGNNISLQDFRGQAVLINFWATWCGPCERESPFIQLLYEKYQDDNFVVIGISTDQEDTIGEVPDFVEKYHLSYPILLDENSVVDTMYETDGITPYSFFISGDGTIRDLHIGELDILNLESKINELIDGTLQATPTPQPNSIFTIINNSEQTICGISLYSERQHEWLSDWLDGETIEPGETYSLDLVGGIFDIILRNCDDTLLIQQYDENITGSFEYILPLLTATLHIVNNSDTSICNVHISLSTSSVWGADWLINNSITPTETYSFNILPGTYDILLADCNDNVLTREMEVDISDTFELRFEE